MRLPLILAVAFTGVAQAQVVITSEDMFNQIGQYWRAYANSSDVPVSFLLGNPGGPQSWDFRNGPADETWRFDYVAPSDGGHGADFPRAKFAERKTVEVSGEKSWLYLEQVPGVGRVNYGFYDEEFSPTMPSSPFAASIVDFPATVSYQQTWNTATSFKTEISFDVGPDPEDPEGGAGTFAIPAQIYYSSTAKADAYGVVNLPGVGFGEGLRVNELVTYVIEVDLEGNGQYQQVATEYVRNYYWLVENRGIAVQITSKQQSTPPPDNFPLAAHLVRLFETNHGEGTRTSESITDFTITISRDRALLSWTKLGSVTSYRVEYTEEIGGLWKELGSTTSNFLIDSNISGAAHRFYRVVGLKQ